MVGESPVTSTQIKQAVAEVRKLDQSLAFAIDELFYQAETYGFSTPVHKDENSQTVTN